MSCHLRLTLGCAPQCSPILVCVSQCWMLLVRRKLSLIHWPSLEIHLIRLTNLFNIWTIYELWIDLSSTSGEPEFEHNTSLKIAEIKCQFRIPGSSWMSWNGSLRSSRRTGPTSTSGRTLGEGSGSTPSMPFSTIPACRKQSLYTIL